MDSQATILASRIARIREYKDEIARLRAENLRLRGEVEARESHFSLALMAAVDFALLPHDGRFIIVDGWNIVLGDGRRKKRNPKRIVEIARRHLAIHKADFIWIVWDGQDEGGWQDGRLRVSWTGGTGKQRADRFICDFIRMARWRGLAERLRILTSDKELKKSAKRLVRRMR